MRYTLVVTPDAATNDGTITVTVAADAVIGMTTNTGNPLTSVTRNYDTVAPVFTSDATATAAVGDPASTVVYTATATDGGDADNRITYIAERHRCDDFQHQCQHRRSHL